MPATTKPVVRVAFVGSAGSGKTTHARALQKVFGGDIVSFASFPKRLCRDLFGEKMEDPTFYREVLQTMCTDWARKFDEDVWVRKVKLPTNRSAFSDDCRFYNEFNFLREQGFLFVRLSAQPAVLAVRRPSMTEAQHRHESETQSAMFRVDLTFDTTPVLEDEQEDIARVSALIERAIRERYGQAA